MKKEIDSDTSDKILGSQISSLRKDEIPPDTEIKSQIITNNLSELGQVNRISKIGQKFLKIPQQNQIQIYVMILSIVKIMQKVFQQFYL